jgi:hypothetical protein
MNDLIPIEYKNQRIMITEQLAEVYGTDTNNIKNNFNNHRNNFQEGKHYYLLQGKELKEFKSQVNNIDQPIINKFASQLYLWTERGANRHCKILDTDKAWKQFDNLEETYFKVKKIKELNENSNRNNEEISFEEKMKQLKMEQSQLAFIMDRMHLSQASEIKMLKDFNESEGLSTSYLNISTDEKAGISATNLLKQLNIPMSTIKFNKLMEQCGYMEKRKRKSTNERGYKIYNVIIGEGLKYGKNVINSSGSEKETQPLYYESTFMELIDLILPSKDRRCS